MSRIGKKPIAVPKNVTATVDGQRVTVKGPKGQLSIALIDDVEAALEDGAIVVKPRSETKRARSMWGMSRSLVENLVTGTTNGFSRTLEITGVGYRAAMDGKSLKLQLGYSHDIFYPVPEGISIVVPKPTEITISGIEKDKVGQVAAEIRGFRGPEPYKGKGIRYQGEYIQRKEGKKK
ncbi:MAG: 50S ribosomal protein L6 [Rhodomicrobium sp.]|jgi:large subunit ribosomal protein L6